MRLLNEAFCPRCSRKVPYTKKVETMTDLVNEVQMPYPEMQMFSYPKITMTCTICGSEITDPNIMFENARERENAYYKRLYSLTGGKKK